MQGGSQDCSPTHAVSRQACQLLGELRSCGDRARAPTTTTTTAQGPVQSANGMCGVLTKYLNSSSSPRLGSSHTKYKYQDEVCRGESVPTEICCSVLSCCKECEVDRCLGVYIVRTEQIYQTYYHYHQCMYFLSSTFASSVVMQSHSVRERYLHGPIP